MANTHGKARRLELQAQRRAWLEARPELLARLPSSNDDVDDAQSAALDDAVKQMKFYKLYGPTTPAMSLRWGIRQLVAELRRERVTSQDPKYRQRGWTNAT